MAIINHSIPNLPPQAETYRVLSPADRIWTMMKKNRGEVEVPADAPNPPLFGHLADPNYIAPAEGWEDDIVAGDDDNDAPPPPPPPPPPPAHQPPPPPLVQPQPQPAPQPEPQLQQPQPDEQPQPQHPPVLQVQDVAQNVAIEDVLDQAAEVDPERGDIFVQGIFDPNDPIVQVDNFQGLDNLDLYVDDRQDAQNQNLDTILQDIEGSSGQPDRDIGSSSRGKNVISEPERESDIAMDVDPDVSSSDSDSEATVVEVQHKRDRDQDPDYSPGDSTADIHSGAHYKRRKIARPKYIRRSQESQRSEDVDIGESIATPSVSVPQPSSTVPVSRVFSHLLRPLQAPFVGRPPVPPPSPPVDAFFRPSTTTSSSSATLSVLPTQFTVNQIDLRLGKLESTVTFLQKKYDDDIKKMQDTIAQLVSDLATERVQNLELKAQVARLLAQGGDNDGQGCKQADLRQRDDEPDDDDAATRGEPMNQAQPDAAATQGESETGPSTNVGAGASTSEAPHDHGDYHSGCIVCEKLKEVRDKAAGTSEAQTEGPGNKDSTLISSDSDADSDTSYDKVWDLVRLQGNFGMCEAINAYHKFYDDDPTRLMYDERRQALTARQAPLNENQDIDSDSDRDYDPKIDN